MAIPFFLALDAGLSASQFSLCDCHHSRIAFFGEGHLSVEALADC
jgi:hypothetical protein